MKRFSKLFYFTVIAGGILGAIYAGGVVLLLKAEAGAVNAQCSVAKEDCTEKCFHQILPLFSIAELFGVVAILFVTYAAGKKFIKAASRSSGTDGA